MIYRVHKLGRRFSNDWIKEFGENSENVVGFGPNKERPDGKDERTGQYKEAPNTSALSVTGQDQRLSSMQQA